MLALVLALTAGLVTAAPAARPLQELSLGALRSPDLALHLVVRGPDGAAVLALDDGEPRGPGAGRGPVCSGDVCQPVVSVPGFEPTFDRTRRGEVLATLLVRAHVEPFATVAWAIVASGVHLDYTPVGFDGPNAGGHGWGSAILRVRFRLDAGNHPVIPERPR